MKQSKIIFIIFVVFALHSSVYAQNGMNTNLPLLFQTGFESTTRLTSAQNPKFEGKDETLKEKNDWVTDINHFAGGLFVNFTGGDSTQRFAKIISEPGKTDNKVLHFQLNEGWMNGRSRLARAQFDLSLKTGVKEFYQTIRIFLPEDMKTVSKFPKPIHWLTILELWNNIQWVETVPYAFRITLGMGKPTEEESDLIFIIDAEDFERDPNAEERGYIKRWVDKNHDIKVPIGEWFTMHYYFKEGNAENGRFIVDIETEKNGRQTVFDITNFTHNTKDPAPDGLTVFNPLKLYTSMDLANFMKEQGKALQIYWDDFKLYGK